MKRRTPTTSIEMPGIESAAAWLRLPHGFDGRGFHSLLAVSIVAHVAALAVAPVVLSPRLNVRSERISVSVRTVNVPAPPVAEVAPPEPIVPEKVVEKPIPDKPKPVAKIVPKRIAPPAPAPQPQPAAAARVEETVARVVDTEPVPWSRNRPPSYPQSAQNAGQEGTVFLKLLVLSSGKVGNVKMLRSSGFTILDNAARKAAARYRFTPASRAGRAVEYEATIPFEFELTRHSRASQR